MSNSYVPLNLDHLRSAFVDFPAASPFPHAVIDQFVKPEVLQQLAQEFLDYDSPKWFCYKNAIENKKALNDWNAFPPETYRFFCYLNSPEFLDELSSLVGETLYSDSGLHGGGWHCHGVGGNLNPHLDYSLHPKINLQRKINLIIYVSQEMLSVYGGHLGLWEHDSNTNRPGKLIKEVAPLFNRAVIFDTTKNSWHGLSKPLTQPDHIFRKSLAVYYLSEPDDGVSQRGRALFAPREDQASDAEVEELIRMRMDMKASLSVYKKD
ncbi:2OG-Fe(II) oxygenase [Herbaspirillum sp. NPDC101396]|uniref:2OG-Fe(II) oxygenase n=1 Tax=Herbaspirillum sp. NPDC101396 TaxID=3364005 RepID=UPI00383B4F95